LEKTKNIVSYLRENQNLLVVCKSKTPAEITKQICLDAPKNFKKIVVVSFNKSFADLIQKFENDKVDKKRLHFIDCISARYLYQIPSNQATYLSSPLALTELAILLADFLNESDLVVIDSISSLAVFNGFDMALRFINGLMLKIRKTNAKSICLFIPDSKKELLDDISLFADKVLTA
jgi:hypothetical protein